MQIKIHGLNLKKSLSSKNYENQEEKYRYSIYYLRNFWLELKNNNQFQVLSIYPDNLIGVEHTFWLDFFQNYKFGISFLRNITSPNLSWNDEVFKTDTFQNSVSENSHELGFTIIQNFIISIN